MPPFASSWLSLPITLQAVVITALCADHGRADADIGAERRGAGEILRREGRSGGDPRRAGGHVMASVFRPSAAVVS